MNQLRPGAVVALGTILLLAGGHAAHPSRHVGASGSNKDEGLTLRVDDAEGVPGGTVSLVLRTYAPRPVRQGQISVVVRPPLTSQPASLARLTAPLRPVAFLLSVTVYSELGDAVVEPPTLASTADSQRLGVGFASASASINSADGPLAVFRLRLDPSVVPGQVFDLAVDPIATGLLDENGRPLLLTVRSGRLTIRAPRSSRGAP